MVVPLQTTLRTNASNSNLIQDFSNIEKATALDTYVGNINQVMIGAIQISISNSDEKQIVTHVRSEGSSSEESTEI